MSSKLNRWRADRAVKGLKAFAEGEYGDLSDPDRLKEAIIDMLCDLMHLAQLNLHLPGERSFNGLAHHARERYSVEKMERESDDSPYRFGGLRPVDKETFKENYDFLKDSGIGCAPELGRTKSTRILVIFVQGHPILRIATTDYDTTRHCDRLFFRYLRNKENTPTVGAGLHREEREKI